MRLIITLAFLILGACTTLKFSPKPNFGDSSIVNNQLKGKKIYLLVKDEITEIDEQIPHEHYLRKMDKEVAEYLIKKYDVKEVITSNSQNISFIPIQADLYIYININEKTLTTDDALIYLVRFLTIGFFPGTIKKTVSITSVVATNPLDPSLNSFNKSQTIVKNIKLEFTLTKTTNFPLLIIPFPIEMFQPSLGDEHVVYPELITEQLSELIKS